MRSLNISSCFQRLSGGEGDGAGLAAGNGRFGLVLGQAQPALDAAGLGARHIAGHARDLGVVIGFHHDLVVRPQPLEHGVHGAHLFAAGIAAGRQQHRQQGKAVMLHTDPFSRSPHSLAL
jgi:hypothetical protein